MTAEGRKTLLRSAIALDLAVIATGVALLLPPSPLVVLACFFAVVLAGTWLGEREGGATATVVSVVLFSFVFDDVLRLHDYVFFFVAAATVTGGIPWLREHYGSLGRVATIAVSAARPRRKAPVWLLTLALPVFVALVYSDISEVLILQFGLPSLLQLTLAGLMVVIFYYRDALVPSRILLQPLTLTLLAYSAVIFLSSAWADDLDLADRAVERIVKNLLIYAVVAILAASATTLRRGFAASAIVAAGLSAISIVQIATGNTFGELGGLATVAYGNIYGDASDARAAGPLGDANFYGQVLVMIIPLGTYLAYSASRLQVRLFWLGVTTVIAAGVLVTYSRGAMLGLAVMTALVLAALRVPITRVALATAGVIVLIVIMPGNIGRRFMTFEALFPGEQSYVAPDSSFEKRKLLTATAVHMFDDNPWVGVGAGNYTTFFFDYSNQVGSAAELFNRPGELEHAHSLYLEIGAETGVLGLLVFLTIIVAAAAQLWIARQDMRAGEGEVGAMLALALAISLAGYLVTSLFLHGQSQRYFALVLAFIAALTRVAADARNAAQGSS